MAQSKALPQPIEQILTHLGDTITPKTHLTDVLAAFETIITALQDSWLECGQPTNAKIQTLKEQIQTSSKALADLPTWNITSMREAEEEVCTVVNATETAANKIMEQAEIILNAETSAPEAYAQCVTDAVMQIFEACAFQDITGQRLARVSETLDAMEKQAERAIDIIGADRQESETIQTDKDQRKKDLLLHGPSNEGEGVSQEDIDALFD